MFLIHRQSYTLRHPLADLTFLAHGYVSDRVFEEIIAVLDLHAQRPYNHPEKAWIGRYRFSKGRLIIYYREQRGWCQTELAQLLQIHPAGLSRLENNRRLVPRKIALRLAEIFECDHREFL